MGNREYVMTFKFKPPYKVGNYYEIYLGKGLYTTGVIKDIRYHNLAEVYIMKVSVKGNSKKYSK